MKIYDRRESEPDGDTLGLGVQTVGRLEIKNVMVEKGEIGAGGIPEVEISMMDGSLIQLDAWKAKHEGKVQGILLLARFLEVLF